MSRETHKVVAGSWTSRPSSKHFKRDRVTPSNKSLRFHLRARPDAQSADPQDAFHKFLGGAAPLTAEQVQTMFDISPDTRRTIIMLASAHGLKYVSYNPILRLIEVEADAKTVRQVFKVSLVEYKIKTKVSGTKTFTGRVGNIKLPNDLHALVQSVHGIDARPKARTKHRHMGTVAEHAAALKAAKVRGTSYSPLDGAKRINTPLGNFGLGASLAFVSLSGKGEGGINPNTINKHNAAQGLGNAKWDIECLDGAENNPNADPGGPAGEDALDSQTQSVLFNALLTMFLGMNSTASFANCITAAAKHKNKPTILTISWGQYESGWTQQDFDLMEDALAIARAAGINIFAAAGDDGVTDRDPDGNVNADYPSSSQKVCGVAGVFDPNKANFAGVTVWNRSKDIPPHGASGGGVSKKFKLSPGQQKLKDAGFNIPKHIETGEEGKVDGDVSHNGDPYSGCQVMFPDGSLHVIGGTSWGAPGVGTQAGAVQATVGRNFDFLDTTYTALAADKVGLCVPVTVGDNSTLTKQGYKADSSPFSAPGGCGLPMGDRYVTYLQSGKSPSPTPGNGKGKGKKHGGGRKAA